ncbi:hypothetical protein [Allosphingosinicella humi]
MDGTFLAGIFGLGGVALGGGLTAIQAYLSRRADAAAVLGALAAEVEAITRLVNHRRYLHLHVSEAEQCRALIAQGRGHEMVPGFQIALQQDYFALFNSLGAKIGLLKPYHADRIVRFYVLAKSATENMLPGSPLVENCSATERLQALESDMALLHVLLILGNEIAGFRKVDGPASQQFGSAPPEFPSIKYWETYYPSRTAEFVQS